MAESKDIEMGTTMERNASTQSVSLEELHVIEETEKESRPWKRAFTSDDVAYFIKAPDDGEQC